MNTTASILSTANLDQSLTEHAAEQGIALDVLPFVHIELITEDALRTEVNDFCELPITAVFTSANAVRAVAGMMGKAAPAWNIYCVGNATKKEVLKHFDGLLIKGDAADSESLATVIVDHDVLEVVFFCGDKRMDTLPELLALNNIVVHEIVVYQTSETPHVAAKPYDGILFFSPSGVNSFFSANTLGKGTVLFAIGNTTAAAIKEKSGNTIVICNTASKEHMVDDAIQYFQKTGAASRHQTIINTDK